MPETSAAPEKKILDIERLRGLAVAAVVFTHLELSSDLFRALGLDPKRVPFWLGVELFFVISGFVVTKSFTSRAMNLRVFYVRRVLRLWPTLAVFFVLVILANAWAPVPPTAWRPLRADLLSVLFGCFTIWNGGNCAFCGAMWSLSVEEQFYLAAPLTLLLLSWVFRSRWSAACRCGAAGFVLLLTAVRCACYLGVPAAWLSADRIPPILVYLANLRFDFLALGVLLYFQLRTAAPSRRPGRVGQRCLMAAGLVLPLAAVYPLGESLQSGFQAPLLYTVGWGVAGAAFYGVVGLAARDRELLRLPGLADRLLLYLGSRSYGIYVIHFPLLVVGWHVVRAWAVRDATSIWFGAGQAAATLPFVWLLSEGSFRFVERPFIQLGGRIAARLTAPKSPTRAVSESRAPRRLAG